MDRIAENPKPNRHLFLVFFCVSLYIHGSYGKYHDGLLGKNAINSQLTKVQLTQKGYIQFLRYVEDVPSITKYTFCIWMKSYDLSHAHPLLSYSKDEKERLIRVWISPRGKSLSLELHGNLVFEIPTQFREHLWYHVCQSWDSSTALWELFINGKKFWGRDPKLTGLIIKAGGDIIVAQEYTDFDKGLEDGIEGEIFGFNFALSSTSKMPRYSRFSGFSTGASKKFQERLSLSTHRSRYNPLQTPNSKGIFDAFFPVPNILPPWETHYFPPVKQIYGDFLFPQKTPGGDIRINSPKNVILKPPNALFAFQTNVGAVDNMFRNERLKSTGLMLVEMSRNCRVGQGGPLRGQEVLINWAKTKVRVFGGAIIKPVEPFC